MPIFAYNILLILLKILLSQFTALPFCRLLCKSHQPAFPVLYWRSLSFINSCFSDWCCFTARCIWFSLRRTVRSACSNFSSSSRFLFFTLLQCTSSSLICFFKVSFSSASRSTHLCHLAGLFSMILSRHFFT